MFLLRPPSSAYDDDAIIDMAGGSVAHAALCARMASLLDQALAESPCAVYTSDARNEIPTKYLYALHCVPLRGTTKRYLYSDVTVACDEQAGTMLTNPVVVIEVLSPTTEKRDHGAKFKAKFKA